MTTFFVSDLHLKPERPDITRAFSHFITHTAAQAESLYLLGDIFEAWIGDDAPTPGLDELFSQLKALSENGCKIFLQHGNRDFLMGEQCAERMGASLLHEQVTHRLPVGNCLILHGDQLCLDDNEYMQFRALVRNPQWQQDFLSKSLQERIQIAKQLRDTSKQRGAEKSDYITDVSSTAVAQALQQADVKLMIHGHTHKPYIHQIDLDGTVATRIVLGDWDSHGWYLKMDSQGYDLVKFPINNPLEESLCQFT